MFVALLPSMWRRKSKLTVPFFQNLQCYIYVHQLWKTSVCRGINKLTTHVPTLNLGLDGNMSGFPLGKSMSISFQTLHMT
jgi:hypothetical protein